MCLLRSALLALCLGVAAFPTPALAESRVQAGGATLDADGAGDRVVAVAMTALGAPYRWAGVSPATGFDCSGFVLWAFSQFGLAVPHSEVGQLNAGARLGANELAPGDIVVFKNTYKPGPSHTGIYVGDGRFIHAVDVGIGVVISNMWDSYWGPRFVAGVRVELPFVGGS